jgi:hypothetical protein
MKSHIKIHNFQQAFLFQRLQNVWKNLTSHFNLNEKHCSFSLFYYAFIIFPHKKAIPFNNFHDLS